MKTQSILVLSAIFCLMACDKAEETQTVTDVAGSYEGYTLASCAYFQNTCSAGETITVTANNDGSAHVAFSSASWGEFTITNAQMSVDGSNAILSGSGQTQMGMGGNVSSYDCTFTAEIQSKEKARMQFKVPAVMGGLTLDFATGEAPAELLLAGSYKGYTDADCRYFQDRYTNDESVILTANDDGTVKVVFESASWGTFTVTSATITQEGGVYAFSGEGSVAMGMGGSTSNYDFTLSGSTNAAKDTFSIAFTVPAVMGGLTITLLPGSAPSVEE